MQTTKRFLLAAIAATLAAAASPVLAQATWKPSKPITIIVPWAAARRPVAPYSASVTT